MPLHVKPRDVAAWVAQAQDQGLAVAGVRGALRAKKRPKRTPEQLRADLVRAIDLAPSDLGRRVLGRALARYDKEHA